MKIKRFDESLISGKSVLRKIMSTDYESGELSKWMSNHRMELPTSKELESFKEMFLFCFNNDMTLSSRKVNSAGSNSEFYGWYNIYKSPPKKNELDVIQFYKYNDDYYVVSFIYKRSSPDDTYLCDGWDGIEMLAKYKKGEVDFPTIFGKISNQL